MAFSTLLLAGSLTALSGLASAQETPSSFPAAAWFGGAGGSFTSVDLTQTLDGFSSPTQVTQNGTLVATGIAGGPTEPFRSSENRLAPEAQVGYFEQFAASSWLWGFKLIYQYEGVHTANREIVPQVGQFTPVGGSTDSFTGHFVVGSSETRVKHQLTLFPFFGHAFGNGFIYGGGGPMLLDVETDINNAIGFADINGVHSSITGAPVSFADTEWVWGGGVQVGLVCFLDASWFVDFNYTYARTQQFSHTFSAPFSNSFVLSGDTFTTSGVANLAVGDTLTSQSASISLNKAF